MNFGEVRRAELAKSNLFTATLVPHGFIFRSYKVCSDAKEKVGCGKQREAVHIFLGSEYISHVTLVSETRDPSGAELGRNSIFIHFC